jgi:hypothetical protein
MFKAPNMFVRPVFLRDSDALERRLTGLKLNAVEAATMQERSRLLESIFVGFCRVRKRDDFFICILSGQTLIYTIETKMAKGDFPSHWLRVEPMFAE